MNVKSRVFVIYTIAYGTLVAIILLFIMHPQRHGTQKCIQVSNRSLGEGFQNAAHNFQDRQDVAVFNKFGILDDYFQRDFIVDNHLVDKLTPLLKTNKEVIDESQRIQFKMLQSLVGKFKYAMLFNFAAFENKGDPAITVGEITIIRKLGLKLIFQCATRCKRQAVEYSKRLSTKYSTDELVIFMQGGGNLLAYAFEDFNRKLVLESFPDFEVILFPQSVWQNVTINVTRLFQDVYAKHKNLTFLYRDRNSYNLGKKLFPSVRCYLMPDMAFQIGRVQRFMKPTHDILWLRRHDKASTKYDIPARSQNHNVIIGNWRKWKTPKGSSQLENSFLMAANGLLFLQRGRVVITDRLHGHILCVLLGIPHVIIDPVNKKITSYMQTWTGGLEHVVLAYSPEDALNKAVYLLRKLDD